MSMNAYNIVWADDEIDVLLEQEDKEELKTQGFNIVGLAHNGKELESCLRQPENIDAVIIDANFNENSDSVKSERDTTGLEFARSLYIHKYNRKIPFFLFTNRTDEQLKEKYQYNLQMFHEDFPRHKRWFNKGQNEWNEMFAEIKRTVDDMKSPKFIVRNRYKKELEAASLFDETKDFVFDFLVRDYNNDFEGLREPFVSVRRAIEKIFAKCEKFGIIPPISQNTNGTAAYFMYNCYIQNKDGKNIDQYRMLVKNIMPQPLAVSLRYIVNITQDASHSKAGMKVNVDDYFEKRKDTFLLRSVVYILLDIIKWYAETALAHNDEEVNSITLWEEVKN